MHTIRMLIASVCWLTAAGFVQAEDQPLIPQALNSVLPNILAGMSTAQVQAVLKRVYPRVEGRKGVWSGQTGYIAFKLNDRFSLSVSAITRDGTDVIHDKVLLYVIDWDKKRKVELKVIDWDAEEETAPSRKKNVGESGPGE